MQQRTLSLVGPGRAGTAIATALVARGWRVVGVTGRDPGRAAAAAADLGAVVAPLEEVAADAVARAVNDYAHGHLERRLNVVEVRR